MKKQKKENVVILPHGKSISNKRKRRFIRQMSRRIWATSESFLNKEIKKYENIRIIYD